MKIRSSVEDRSGALADASLRGSAEGEWLSQVKNFVLNEKNYQLDAQTVINQVRGIVPGHVQAYSVNVDEVWFPVKQAFECATGIPRSEFTSQVARRHLAALGFSIADVRESPMPSRVAEVIETAPVPKLRGEPANTEEWHTEANIQAALVNWLVHRGWRILSVANTATKEHGIDVIARRDDLTAGIEVKGYPSKNYADPARAAEKKRTSPSTQSAHWFSQAIFAAMRLRTSQPDTLSVVALPDFARYRNLHAETRSSLEAAGIQIWWVDRSGDVHTEDETSDSEH